MRTSIANAVLIAAAVGLVLVFLVRVGVFSRRPKAEESVSEWAQRIERENRTGHQFSSALLVRGAGRLWLIDTRSVVPGEHRALLQWLDGATPGRVVSSQTYGTSPGVIGRALLPAKDGDLFILGEAREEPEAYRGWVSRLSADGTVRWQQSLGPSGVTGLRTGWVTPDGGLIAIGEQGFQGWVVRLEADGRVRWQKILPELQRLAGLVAVGEDRLLLIGQIEVSTAGPGRAAVMAVGLDGTSAWLHDFTSVGRIDLAAAAALPGGDVVLLGQRATEKEPKLWAARFDPGRRALSWQIEHGGAGELSAAIDVATRPSGELAIVGRVMTAGAERKLLVLGVDPAGRISWERRWGGEADYATRIVAGADGGLVVAGSGQGRGQGRTQALLWHLSATGELRAEQVFAAP
ncbi:hypothetical protein [Haliangium sp. UPWRP_2]|uniref:hypothetical protein n=1 Tax=Haliangium sp. UPWRP_2 TaxID=1931276 RepID=UPI000B547F0B|nr:hypothetical protein [Haliangium sp. UPWRP_2]PSM32388.1 hypothetical protein BVG81_000710 [Haliangium sp. UPWRP_2]